MANFDVPDNLEFSETIRALETTDKAHASLFNCFIEKLFHNTLFLRKKLPVVKEEAMTEAYQQSAAYTDLKINQLVNGAPETLDTLKEVADAIKENETVVTALNDAIGSKANEKEFNSHVANKSNPHNITKAQVGLSNVPNVSTDNQTPTFTEAASLMELESGEKISVLFGKIAKTIKDYISHKTTAGTASSLGHVKVDSELSSTSTNPLQNKVVNMALETKLSAAGDAGNTTVTYTEAAALTELASGEKQSVAFGKLKLAVKNIISIAKLLGTTDISAIGGGTVTGAIASLNSNLDVTNSHILINIAPGVTVNAVDDIVRVLNNQNAKIPTGISLINLGIYSGIMVHKVSHSYGRALCITYYHSRYYNFKLYEGAWSAEGYIPVQTQ